MSYPLHNLLLACALALAAFMPRPALAAVRSHTLVMDLAYETGKYTLTYVDSTNLDYKDEGGKKTIHRSYTGWNNNLMNDARAELLRL